MESPSCREEVAPSTVCSRPASGQDFWSVLPQPLLDEVHTQWTEDWAKVTPIADVGA